MARIIDFNPIVGEMYRENVKKRKNDRFRRDLDIMTSIELESKYNITSAGPCMEVIEEGELFDFMNDLEIDDNDDFYFQNLTDEDLEWKDKDFILQWISTFQ